MKRASERARERDSERERESGERERKKSSPFFPPFLSLSLQKKKNTLRSGAGVSVKTSTNIMGPYSPVAYDVGCRGDTYTPDGPCYGTLLAQQAWVTKVQTCNSSSSQEQWLWVGDQWLSVGSNPKTFGNSRQAWVPLTFDDSVSPPRIQKQARKEILDFCFPSFSGRRARARETKKNPKGEKSSRRRQLQFSPSHFLLLLLFLRSPPSTRPTASPPTSSSGTAASSPPAARTRTRSSASRKRSRRSRHLPPLPAGASRTRWSA